MLQSYRELLEKLFTGVFSGQSVSFGDYLASLGYTMALLACFAGCCVLLWGAYKGPSKVFYVLIRKPMVPINQALISGEDMPKEEEIEELKAELRKGKKIFVAFLVVYIALAIPTLLFIVNFVLQLF